MYGKMGGGGAAVGGGLAVTGSPVATWAALALILLMVGALMVRLATQRRARSARSVPSGP